MLINDNAYSDIIFDGRTEFSFLSLEGAKDVGVDFFSLSKSFNVTGFRISFCIGNPSIIRSFKKLRSQYDFGMPYPVQKVAIGTLDVNNEFFDSLRNAYNGFEAWCSRKCDEDA